ncbi:MAG: RNA 2',3'-cyclic phosphodiesterase [Chloracidobacterium sp.]|nr:RNA 2',3'-cyclic phosphodiesterase [Chloracidobacterium sp.]
MKRTFAAIDLSEEARRVAAAHIDQLRRVFPGIRIGWERSEKLHFTLKFFGDVDEDLIPSLRSMLETVAAEAKVFEAILAGTGRFPPKGDPRILWFGAADNGNMSGLAERIASEASKLGFPKEKRRFTPHLTIARLREPSASHGLALAHLETAFEPVRFEVHGITLYESTLLPGGSVYRKLLTAPFGRA